MDLQRLRMIWLMMLVATVSYAGLGLFFFSVGQTGPNAYFFMIVAGAVGAGVMSFIVPKAAFRTGLRAKDFKVEDAPDANDESMFRDKPQTVRLFAEPEQVRSEVITGWETGFILAVALSEAVAIMGLLLAVEAYAPVYWLPLVAVGAVLVAIRYPTEDKVLDALEAAYDARMPGRSRSSAA